MPLTQALHQYNKRRSVPALPPGLSSPPPTPDQPFVLPPLGPSPSAGFVFARLATRGNHNRASALAVKGGSAQSTDGSCSSINIHFPSTFLRLRPCLSGIKLRRLSDHKVVTSRFSKGALFPQLERTPTFCATPFGFRRRSPFVRSRRPSPADVAASCSPFKKKKKKAGTIHSCYIGEGVNVFLRLSGTSRAAPELYFMFEAQVASS